MEMFTGIKEESEESPKTEILSGEVVSGKASQKKIYLGIAVVAGLILMVVAFTKKKSSSESEASNGSKKKSTRQPVIVNIHNGQLEKPTKKKAAKKPDLNEAIVDEENEESGEESEEGEIA